MKWRVAAAVALIVVGIGAVGVAIVGPDFGTVAPQYTTAQATVTDVVDEVVGTGSIAPHASYALAFGAAPALAGSTSSAASGAGGTAVTWPVETVAVTVGQKVKAGDVLATADATAARAQLAIDQASLKVAVVRLKADEAGATPAQKASAENSIRSAQLALVSANNSAAQTVQSNQLAITQAQNALADARKQLATAEAGPTADVKTSAQDQIDTAQRSLDQAIQSQGDTRTQNAANIAAAQKAVDDADLAWVQARQKVANDQASDVSAAGTAADQAAADRAYSATGTARGNLVSTQLKATQSDEQAATAVSNARAALATAQRQYATNTAPSSTAIDTARQQVRNAELSLESANQKAAAAVVQNSQQIQSAGLQVSSAQTNLTGQLTPLETTLASDAVSVANARVTVADAKLVVDRATVVAPVDGTIVTVNVVPGVAAPSGSAIVMDVGPFEVTADFSETSLAKVRVGQTADVTVTATGTTQSGKVTVIGATPATGGTSSVVTYPVTVALDQEPAGVQIGMTANVAIILSQASSVVAVPTQALRGTSGAYAVRVMDAAGTVAEVPVTVGLVTTSLTEIQSGLSGGETVVTGTVSSTNSSTSSNRSGAGSLFGGGVDFGGPGGGVPGGGGGVIIRNGNGVTVP